MVQISGKLSCSISARVVSVLRFDVYMEGGLCVSVLGGAWMAALLLVGKVMPLWKVSEIWA